MVDGKVSMISFFPEKLMLFIKTNIHMVLKEDTLPLQILRIGK